MRICGPGIIKSLIQMADRKGIWSWRIWFRRWMCSLTKIGNTMEFCGNHRCRSNLRQGTQVIRIRFGFHHYKYELDIKIICQLSFPHVPYEQIQYTNPKDVIKTLKTLKSRTPTQQASFTQQVSLSLRRHLPKMHHAHHNPRPHTLCKMSLIENYAWL